MKKLQHMTDFDRRSHLKKIKHQDDETFSVTNNLSHDNLDLVWLNSDSERVNCACRHMNYSNYFVTEFKFLDRN